MDITPPVALGKQLIQSYGEGGFQIANIRYGEPVLVTAEATSIWPVTDFSSVTLESFAALRTISPAVELLLIGSGDSIQALPAEVRAGLKAWGMVVEIMATGAACRTYDILLSEQRRVAAALIPVS